MNFIPLVFWGMSFCIGYLTGGMHSAVVALLWSLSLSLLSHIFGGVGALISIVLGIALLLGAGASVILIGIAVIFAAWLFLALLS